MGDKKALLHAIAKEEALLSKLDSDREQSSSRLNTLKQQLTALKAVCADPSITYPSRTPADRDMIEARLKLAQKHSEGA